MGNSCKCDDTANKNNQLPPKNDNRNNKEIKKEAPQNLRNSVDDWDIPNNLSQITRTHSLVQKKK